MASAPRANPLLLLYSTSACHLCEQAEQMLLALFAAPGLLPPLVPPGSDEAGIAVEVVDISDDEGLVDRYGLRIPVLAWCDAAGTLHELGWPFQPEQLLYFIRRTLVPAGR